MHPVICHGEIKRTMHGRGTKTQSVAVVVVVGLAVCGWLTDISHLARCELYVNSERERGREMSSIPMKNDFELLGIFFFNKIDSYPRIFAFT